jgi:ribbon-helix-helix CopG family protein
MNFNIYLDDETGKQLNHAADETGESRNALIRRAVSEWLDRRGAARWPYEVTHFNGLPGATRFEDTRDKLKAPVDDPLA